MTTLLIYLIKVNIALILFCMAYYLVLRPLTFYTLNRVYLVGAILFSTLYPLINLSGFINKHQQIARPVQMVIINWQAPVASAVHSASVHQNNRNWLEIVFWAGVLIFAIRLIVQLISLYRLHKRSKPVLLHRHLIRAVNKDISPFSFLRSIYVNPKNHTSAELKAILEHEQVHVNEWHTFDILVGELSIIFYWFNPGIWLMKRAIHENIEFITDQRILQNGLDAKEYQYSLLNVNFNNGSSTLINHFNASAIKKRIIMMNAERSSMLNLSRYVFLIPIIAVLLLAFTVSKTGLAKQVLKGHEAITTAFNDVAEIMEKPLTTTSPKKADKSYAPLLQAVSIARLDEQPVVNRREPEIMPIALAKKTNTIKSDSVNRILPPSISHYPDSLYVDGVYGDTKTMLSNLTDDDLRYITIVRNQLGQCIHIYTRYAKDYKAILAMDAKDDIVNYGVAPRAIIVNGKPVSKTALQKISQDDIEQIQFAGFDANGNSAERGAMWILTK